MRRTRSEAVSMSPSATHGKFRSTVLEWTWTRFTEARRNGPNGGRRHDQPNGLREPIHLPV